MELIDNIKSEIIFRAAKIAMEEGNFLAEISEGWSKIRQVVHMGRELSPLAKRRIEAELPSLRYWNAPRTPQNPGTSGFISDIDEVGLSFPDRSPSNTPVS